MEWVHKTKSAHLKQNIDHYIADSMEPLSFKTIFSWAHCKHFNFVLTTTYMKSGLDYVTADCSLCRCTWNGFIYWWKQYMSLLPSTLEPLKVPCKVPHNWWHLPHPWRLVCRVSPHIMAAIQPGHGARSRCSDLPVRPPGPEACVSVTATFPDRQQTQVSVVVAKISPRLLDVHL